MKNYAEDTNTIDNILAAIYEVISGEEGEKRDWERQRNLFYPGAGMTIVKKSESGVLKPQFVQLDRYIEDFESNFNNPSFYEVQANAIVEQYGSIAHVFSTYLSFYKKEDTEPFKKGINSIQLYFDGDRWWVMSIYWDRDGHLPEMSSKYLPTA